MELLRLVILALATAATPPDAAMEVRAAEIAFAGAFADRDQARFFSHVAEDATFLGPKETLSGKPQVIQTWSGYFRPAKAPFSWRPERVAVNAAGDLGLSAGPVFDGAGKQVGNFSSVWRKQSDGAWKLVFDGPGAPVCSPPEAAGATPAPRATCVFTHAAFAGKCTERPPIPKGASAREACESILRCLNDVQCIRTHCQATTLRTNWKLESAD
jgi:ketosteroid isomerase-like protein